MPYSVDISAQNAGPVAPSLPGTGYPRSSRAIGGGTSPVVKTNISLGTQASNQSDYAWTTVSSVCLRGLMSRLQITAEGSGIFDVQLRSSAGDGALWLEAVDVNGTIFDITAPIYIEGGVNSSLFLGIRNRASASRSFILTTLRAEKFA